MPKGSADRSPSAQSSDPGAFELEFPGASQSANATVRGLVRTYGAVMATFDTALRRHSLSASGRQALAALESAGHPLSPTAISERLMVTTASMTSLLDTLERRGLVTRQRDTADRRKQLVNLTEAGRHIVDEFLPEIVALQTAMLARLTEEERQQLRRSLEVIRATIGEMDAGAVAADAPKRGQHLRTH